jgi:hypothetical protein
LDIAVTYAATGNHALHGLIVETSKAGQRTRCDVIDRDGKTAFLEGYSYKGRRLTHIKTVATAPGDLTLADYEILYEKSGAFLGIKQDGCPFYWNPETTPGLSALHKQISRSLLELVPATVRRAKIKERAWCIALAYDGENDGLSPVIGVGLEKERARWLSSQGKQAPGLVWNPAEYARYEDSTLDLRKKDFDEDCAMFSQVALSKGYTWCERKLLNEVTQALNRLNWAKTLPVTDDFVVYAVDFEGADLKKNLKEGVPAKKLQLLRRRKFL